MRKILIVGAGQSGLHLAHGLLQHGYDVTVMTGQYPEEIRTAPPSVTQFSLPPARAAEARLGLDFYDSWAPTITGVHLGLYPPSAREPVVISGEFAEHAVAVDRRVKQADWLERFDDQGGRVIYHGCTVSDLEHFVGMYDLVVIATGGGELGALFSPDTRHASGSRRRVITQVLCEGIEPSPSGPDRADVISSPLGRIFITPILGQYGPAYSLCVMGPPDGALDGSHLFPRIGQPDPDRVTEWITDTVRDQFPQVFPRVTNAVGIDDTAALVTTIRPHLRHPVAKVGSGCVLGMADAVSATDPVAAQGWNNSSLSAHTYLQHILDHGDTPFTPEWMHTTFRASWDAGLNAAHRISDALHHMWAPDAPAHLAEVITAATTSPEVANRFVGGLADPRDYESWLYSPEAAHAYLREVAQRSA